MCIVWRRFGNTTRLFLDCEVVSKVWVKVIHWLRFTFITPPNFFNYLDCWTAQWRSKKIRQGFWLIWHACILVIWRERSESLMIA